MSPSPHDQAKVEEVKSKIAELILKYAEPLNRPGELRSGSLITHAKKLLLGGKGKPDDDISLRNFGREIETLCKQLSQSDAKRVADLIQTPEYRKNITRKLRDRHNKPPAPAAAVAAKDVEPEAPRAAAVAADAAAALNAAHDQSKAALKNLDQVTADSVGGFIDGLEAMQTQNSPALESLTKKLQTLTNAKASLLTQLKSDKQEDVEKALSLYQDNIRSLSKACITLANNSKQPLNKDDIELLTTFAHTCDTHLAGIDLARGIGTIKIQESWLDDMSRVQGRFQATINKLVLKEEAHRNGGPALTKSEASLLKQHRMLTALVTDAIETMPEIEKREVARIKAERAMRGILEAKNPARLEQAATGLVKACQSLKRFRLTNTKGTYNQFLQYGGFSIDSWNKTVSGLGSAAETFLKPLAAGRYMSTKAKAASVIMLPLAGFVLGTIGVISLLAVGIGIPVAAAFAGTLRGLFTCVLPAIAAGITGSTAVAVVAAVGIAAAAASVAIPILGTMTAGLRVLSPVVITALASPFIGFGIMIGAVPTLSMMRLIETNKDLVQRIERLEGSLESKISIPKKPTDEKQITFREYLNIIFDIQNQMTSLGRDILLIAEGSSKGTKAAFDVAKKAGNTLRHPEKATRKATHEVTQAAGKAITFLKRAKEGAKEQILGQTPEKAKDLSDPKNSPRLKK